MAKEIKKVVLAYSGGLDTTAIIPWLKENYDDNFKERTVSRYVKELREAIGVPKSAPPREYMAVDELPPGKQTQVDFGEMTMPNAGGKGKPAVRQEVFRRCAKFDA